MVKSQIVADYMGSHCQLHIAQGDEILCIHYTIFCGTEPVSGLTHLVFRKLTSVQWQCLFSAVTAVRIKILT